MRIIRSAVLYTALALGANAAVAEGAIAPELLTGDMQKLVPATDEPIPLPALELVDATDVPQDLSDRQGKVLLINFWATWCAPCRKELASLDRLQAALGGEDFEVVTIATGPNPVPAIEKFFADEGIKQLPILRDPNQSAARAMGVLGLPVTVLIGRDGAEAGRLVGDAEWDSDAAKAVVAALIAAQ